MTSSTKEVCFEVQFQFVEFFTTSIKAIRTAESKERGVVATNGSSGAPQIIKRSYEEASVELGEALSRLNKLDAVGTTNDGPTANMVIRSKPKRRCILMPPAKTSRLFGRLDIFVQLEELLTADAGEFSLQSVALHGLGGVGKSSIASLYAGKKYCQQTYDVVLWVHSEKDACLRQSFTDIALRLKLPGAQTQAHEENCILVHDWFQSTDCKWLVVYDNVESADTLAPYWPRATNQGRAIITTRNHSLAFDPAQSGLEITSWDADTGAEFLLFLLKNSIGRDLNSESISARTLSEQLSGHALALSQMAGLIHDGELSIKEFTTMFIKNSQSAHTVDGLSELGSSRLSHLT
ncbi:P-loop containing nucleoside triphosphate hydrolase protein [Ilyonectria robusta]|uniref:P-loop containing nucleoside triphosphate hydrolase protein n=1 Tax=Ilyonectria robusta TaxID=1079257 RepID=UPI001E8D0759|nr:P-loop containing nucleoside triphosphate hydrolase protein [Ilyonectria robusta]KAH8665407.1 P-loop containing nucleoside triphosphate hydrolase protein [Ilyonectria robusta]